MTTITVQQRKRAPSPASGAWRGINLYFTNGLSLREICFFIFSLQISQYGIISWLRQKRGVKLDIIQLILSAEAFLFLFGSNRSWEPDKGRRVS